MPRSQSVRSSEYRLTFNGKKDIHHIVLQLQTIVDDKYIVSMADHKEENRPLRIILIGYMGAGKTTVGRALSKELNIPFYDLDWYIESRMRKTVKQIFDEKGENGFRLMEKSMLHEVAEFENVIISCGGGTPCFFDNMEYMNGQAETVYLKVEPDVLFKHLQMGKSVRPLLLNKAPDEVSLFIREQLKGRELST